jgi:hypothetical protein
MKNRRLSIDGEYGGWAAGDTSMESIVSFSLDPAIFFL